MGQRIGVDIGGSFTDVAILDEETRTVRALKVFSRPDKPGEEIAAGLRLAGARYGMDPGNVSYFTHGTTGGGQHGHPAQGHPAGQIQRRHHERRAR